MFGATVIIGTKNSWNELHYCSINKCLLNKPKQRSIVEKNLFCTLIGLLKLVVFNSYMN